MDAREIVGRAVRNSFNCSELGCTLDCFTVRHVFEGTTSAAKQQSASTHVRITPTVSMPSPTADHSTYLQRRIQITIVDIAQSYMKISRPT